MSNPARTTPDLVAQLLGPNYGPSTDGTMPDLMNWITGASSLVDTVIQLAQAKAGAVAGGSGMFAILYQIPNPEYVERCMAAYFYTHMDPIYTSKSTSGASGSFAGGGSSLDGEANRYKRMAIENDPSGVLFALLNRKIAFSVWLGQRPAPWYEWIFGSQSDPDADADVD